MMRGAAVLLLAGALAIAGCGSSTPSSPAGAPDRSVLPATTIALPPDPNAPPVESVVPVDVTEPCPASASVHDGERMIAESSRLEPMLGQLVAYGAQHPDQFGTYGLLWHVDGTADAFISFTTDLDAHRRALEAIVERPKDLVVCQVPVNGATGQAIQNTLSKELGGRFLSIGSSGMGPVDVVLAADEEQLAGQLVARYGGAIAVRVGALAYPIDTATAACAEPPAPSSMPGLRVEVAPPAGPVTAAGVQPAQLTVVLTNEGDTPVDLPVGGTAVGTILDADGNVVSAAPLDSVSLALAHVDLDPGESAELPLAVSTASCDPSLGYTLPAGDYRLVATVGLSGADSTSLTSLPIPITVGA